MQILDFYSNAIAVLSVAIGASGIVFGLGYASGNRQAKEFGLEELYAAFSNCLLLGLFALLASDGGILSGSLGTLMGGVSTSSCDPVMASNPAICFAYNYLVGSGFSVGGHAYMALMPSSLVLLLPLSMAYIAVSTLSSVTVNLGVLSFGLIALKLFSGPLRGAIDLLIATMFGMLLEASVLKAAAYTAVQVLLPAALLLRFMPPTRALGNFLLSLVIGVVVVYPMTFVLDAQVIGAYYGQSDYALQAQAAASGLSSSANSIGALASSPSQASGNSIALSLQSVSSVIDSFSAQVWEALQELGAFLALEVVQVFVMPVLGLMITSVGVRSISRFLGSEASVRLTPLI